MLLPALLFLAAYLGQQSQRLLSRLLQLVPLPTQLLFQPPQPRLLAAVGDQAVHVALKKAGFIAGYFFSYQCGTRKPPSLPCVKTTCQS